MGERRPFRLKLDIDAFGLGEGFWIERDALL